MSKSETTRVYLMTDAQFKRAFGLPWWTWLVVGASPIVVGLITAFGLLWLEGKLL